MALDSVDRVVLGYYFLGIFSLCGCEHPKRISCFSDVAPEFTTSNGVRRGCAV